MPLLSKAHQRTRVCTAEDHLCSVIGYTARRKMQVFFTKNPLSACSSEERAAGECSGSSTGSAVARSAQYRRQSQRRRAPPAGDALAAEGPQHAARDTAPAPSRGARQQVEEDSDRWAPRTRVGAPEPARTADSCWPQHRRDLPDRTGGRRKSSARPKT